LPYIIEKKLHEDLSMFPNIVFGLSYRFERVNLCWFELICK